MYNRDVERYLEIIRNVNPDIICVTEPDAWWEEQLRVSEKDYPYATKHPLGNTYGMLLYSRLRFVSSEVNFLVEPEIPSIFSVVELRSGDLIDLYCIHPKPPVPTEAPETTERDAELLIVGKKAKAPSRAVIVMGDLKRRRLVLYYQIISEDQRSTRPQNRQGIL